MSDKELDHSPSIDKPGLDTNFSISTIFTA